jgi:hypothetical protein
VKTRPVTAVLLLTAGVTLAGGTVANAVQKPVPASQRIFFKAPGPAAPNVKCMLPAC